MEVKICNRCHKEKPITEFHKCSKNKDGLQCMCKECKSNYQRDNSERHNQVSREWSARNREKHSASTREWQRKNIEHVRERDRKYLKDETVREKARIRRRDYRYCEENRLLKDGCEIHHFFYVSNENDCRVRQNFIVMERDCHILWHKNHPNWCGVILKGDD